MTRLIVLAFALTLASSAQAMPLAPPQQPGEMLLPFAKHVARVCMR